MKALLFALLFFSISIRVFSQQQTGIDTSFIFNQRYTQCERKWVVMSKPDTAKKYTFGFIYLDDHAGFTFRVKGDFRIDKNGRYIVDTSAFANTSMLYRIARNWRKVALVPPAHFAELHIKAQPDWINTYYDYTDTLAHNFHWGFIYNDLDQCDTALVYLNKVYALQPHYKGLEFELIFAHNALNDYDGAIKIITAALEADAINPLLYRELGYAYMKEKNYFKAILAYKTGINLCAVDNQMDTKAEMAINLAEVYKSSGSDDDFKTWGKLAKSWANPGTDVYNFIVGQGF
jgi:tetratricopeptide (TPR) repeat protein